MSIADVKTLVDLHLARPHAYGATSGLLLKMREHPTDLAETARRLIEACGPVGWPMLAFNGWLAEDVLDDLAEVARDHIRDHSREHHTSAQARRGCPPAERLLAHHALRLAGADSPPVYHVAMPEHLLEQWRGRRPLRTGQPTWVPRAPDQASAVIGGAAGPCPRCNGPLERLLRVSAQHLPTVVTTRSHLDAIWCNRCTPFTRATFSITDAAGSTTLATPSVSRDLPLMNWTPFPATPVGLVDCGPRWRCQSWMFADDIENLHRVGGTPVWVEEVESPDCARCGRSMAFAAQIAHCDFDDGEGMTYIFWCDPCSVTAVMFQQT